MLPFTMLPYTMLTPSFTITTFMYVFNALCCIFKKFSLVIANHRQQVKILFNFSGQGAKLKQNLRSLQISSTHKNLSFDQIHCNFQSIFCHKETRWFLHWMWGVWWRGFQQHTLVWVGKKLDWITYRAKL